MAVCTQGQNGETGEMEITFSYLRSVRHCLKRKGKSAIYILLVKEIQISVFKNKKKS